jgi:hypothetical protein
MYGNYDGATGHWSFQDFRLVPGFSAPITGDLGTGRYRLFATTSAGELQQPFFIEGALSLPAVSSKTFEFKTDGSDNVLWRWKIPEAAFGIDPARPHAGRGVLQVYYDDALAGSVRVDVPTHLGSILFPQAVADQLSGMGNRFVFSAQIETTDGNNRSHSTALELDGLFVDLHHPRTDVDGDCDVDGSDLAAFVLEFGLTDTCQTSE